MADSGSRSWLERVVGPLAVVAVAAITFPAVVYTLFVIRAVDVEATVTITVTVLWAQVG